MLYVVEDDDAVRASLLAILEANGFEAKGFANGREFLDALDGHDGSLLILDLQLPDMRGDQVLIAMNEMGHDIKTIVVTGGASNEIKRRAKEAGAVAIFDKPVQNRLLIQKIREFLEN